MSVPTGSPNSTVFPVKSDCEVSIAQGLLRASRRSGARAELHDHLGRPVRTHPDRAGEQVDIAGLDTVRQYRAAGAHERWVGGSSATEDGQGQRAAGQHRPAEQGAAANRQVGTGHGGLQTASGREPC